MRRSTTDETRRVLSGFSEKIAPHYPCESSHIRKIKNGDQRDPFADFLHLFRACVKGGADVDVWLRKLQCVREAANAKDDPSDRYCLAKNLEASGKLQTTLAIIEADGVIERCEATEVLKLVEPVKMSVKQIENKMMKAVM